MQCVTITTPLCERFAVMLSVHLNCFNCVHQKKRSGYASSGILSIGNSTAFTLSSSLTYVEPNSSQKP